ncbi:MAG: alpha/beta hydrolase family protein [Acidiferrobacteraceae bacterium]
MFSGGWGSDVAIKAVVGDYTSQMQPIPISVEWDEPILSGNGLTECHGHFAAPRYAAHLPIEARTVYIKRIWPTDAVSPPLVVHLPTTREEGFSGRDRTAAELACHGIGSVLIEGAFLGRRRPASQSTATLLHLSDFFLLCGSAIEESRSLLAWLAAEGTSKLCVAGVSKGGYIAAAAGAKMPFPVAVATIVAPESGRDVFIRGLTYDRCDWRALRSTAPKGKSLDAQITALFEQTALSRLAAPSPRTPIIAVGAHKDRFVPPEAYRTLHSAWPTVELRWLPGGHISAIAERSHLIDAVCDAVDRLDA